jgi:predicted metallo-beta-lactamase superfamily hydrolase
MKVTPLSSESLGCRSMATFIETGDCKILIDPGCSIVSSRFDLPPHPLEHWNLKKHRERIFLFAQDSQFIIITHFHETHFSPNKPLLYKDKTLLIKNPNQRIHFDERHRAFDFIKSIQGIPQEIVYVDGRTLRLGETVLGFSDSIPHGDSTDHYIIQVSIKEKEDTFVYTSDVEGLYSTVSADFILDQNPTFLYLDGPVTYFQEDNQNRDPLRKQIDRIIETLEKVRVKTLLFDHHVMRDVLWQEKMASLFDLTRQKDIPLWSVAEFRGEEIDLLEARRRELFKEDFKGRKFPS